MPMTKTRLIAASMDRLERREITVDLEERTTGNGSPMRQKTYKKRSSHTSEARSASAERQLESIRI